MKKAMQNVKTGLNMHVLFTVLETLILLFDMKLMMEADLQITYKPVFFSTNQRFGVSKVILIFIS